MEYKKDIVSIVEYTETDIKLKKVESFKKFKKLRKGMERYYGCPNSKDGYCVWADIDEIDDLLIEFIKALDYDRKCLDQMEKNYKKWEDEYNNSKEDDE